MRVNAPIQIHHAGKMGDVIYALPVMRALARRWGQQVHLTTSGLCIELVPLLWEQPYIANVSLDQTRPYAIQDGVATNWEYYHNDGINMSLQPAFYQPDCPQAWTFAYAWLVGLKPEDMLPEDYVALPSLLNHRRWLAAHQLVLDGKPVRNRRATVIIAPEVESLEPAPMELWTRIIAQLSPMATVLVVGTGRSSGGADTLAVGQAVDLRAMMSVPILARHIADAAAFIGANSLPWHLARHAGVPNVCFQLWRDGLKRCVPVDTPYTWCNPDEWQKAVDVAAGAVDAWKGG